MSKFYGKTIGIDSDKLKNDLDKLPKKMRSLSRISTKVLGKNTRYMKECFNKNGMNKDCLEKLCGVFGLNMRDYVVVPKLTPTVITSVDPIEEEVVSIVLEETQPDNMDLNGIVKSISELTKAVNHLITIESNICKKMESIEQRLAKIEMATAHTSKVVGDSLNSVDEGVAKVNSKLNIVNGRLGDIVRK